MPFAGPLYDRAPDRISGGLGSGSSCAICGSNVKADELELELEFATGERRDSYTVHLACYSALKSKRREREPSRATVTVSELSGADADSKFAPDERQAAREQGEA